MPRFEYKFIRLRGKFWTMRPVLDEYQTVIENEARAGWRFVQAFAPAIYGYGQAKFFDLIFEKPVG